MRAAPAGRKDIFNEISLAIARSSQSGVGLALELKK